MQALLELVHTCFSVLGCGCLEPAFWKAGPRRSSPPVATVATVPRASDSRAQAPALEELLLATDFGDAASSDATSEDDELLRQASFQTHVSLLRSTSPFYKMQQSQLSKDLPSPGMTSSGSGIELKHAGPNILLGQQHYEQRGKFVAAHPVRRGPSPHSHSQTHLGGS